jgi:hypothetical protein
MRSATALTVLGDFAGAHVEYFGVTTTFFRDGEKFMVRTDGPDGALHEYPIAYTFGVYPLQQYLIASPLASWARSRAPSSALGSQRTLRWRELNSNFRFRAG